MTEDRLSIIILNYNTKDLTVRSVRSCLDLAYKGIQVVVVDNASSDGSQASLQELAREEERLSLILLDQNKGFAGGNNVALKRVHTEYVMLLNSDAYWKADADVESVLDFLDQYPDVGMLTPYVELSSRKMDPACHRGFPTPWNALSYFAKLEKITASIPLLNRIFGGYHQTWKNTRIVHEIDACTGAAMILRRNAMDEVGLLDERFFMYGEDLDWCYRFHMEEWKIIFYPQLTVIHDKHSSGIKKGKTEQVGSVSDHRHIRTSTKNAFYDAMKLFYQKHDLGPAWSENLVLLAISLLAKIR